MRKILMTDNSARLLKLKSGEEILAGGVKRVVKTIPNYDPNEDQLLTDKEVGEIIKNKPMDSIGMELCK